MRNIHRVTYAFSRCRNEWTIEQNNIYVLINVSRMKFLLDSSIEATCFGRVDQLHALNT